MFKPIVSFCIYLCLLSLCLHGISFSFYFVEHKTNFNCETNSINCFYTKKVISCFIYPKTNTKCSFCFCSFHFPFFCWNNIVVLFNCGCEQFLQKKREEEQEKLSIPGYMFTSSAIPHPTLLYNHTPLTKKNLKSKHHTQKNLHHSSIHYFRNRDTHTQIYEALALLFYNFQHFFNSKLFPVHCCIRL